MKKILILTLLAALCALLLCGCHRSEKNDADAPQQPDADAFAPTVTAVPDEGYHGEEDQSAALESMPTLEPVVPLEGADEGGAPSGEEDYFSIDAMLGNAGDDEAPAQASEPAADGEAPANTTQPAVDTSTYQYAALTDTSLGFTFNYPSHWENLPGVYTICFREKVEDGDFPARVAITAKTLVHTPDDMEMTEQLTNYLRLVRKQYDASTFQAGTVNTEEKFLGKPAMSNTYLAYSGDHEVKGYIIGAHVKRTVYVLHFCATYEDYAAMESMMRYMVKSCELIDKDD